MSKIIKKFSPELVQKAVNQIAEPVIQTITPLGNNVMFEKDFHTLITNDGATIAKLIHSDDEVEDSIIQMVKYGSLATNKVAGDGTSTTILLTKKLVDMGLEEIAKGTKPMLLKERLEGIKDDILAKSEALKKDVTEDDWFRIAEISTSGNKELASRVVEAVQTAGLDGMIFLDESKNSETRIKKDTGYNLEYGMFDASLSNAGPGRAEYNKPYVFITDKKLYHVEECREILETAHKHGIKDIVILARDFLGESSDFLIANHVNEKVPLNILMVKVPTEAHDHTQLYDIATYLGGKVVTEKMGKLVGKLTVDHYTLANKVYSFGNKTVLVTDNKTNPELTMLVEDLRQKKEADTEDQELANRLASLTSGTVSLEVGAATGPELRELIYKYEDAINATRSAIRSGYVVGGGMTLYNSTRELDEFGKELGLSSIKQIAENCGVKFDESDYLGDTGYNAKKGEFSNLAEDGVIEPYDVFKYSIINSFSVAIGILTSGYFIVNKKKKDND